MVTKAACSSSDAVWSLLSLGGTRLGVRPQGWTGGRVTRPLVRQHLLIWKHGGCVSGFSQWLMVRALGVPGPNYAPLSLCRAGPEHSPKLNSAGMWAGSKVREETLPSGGPCCLPMETPPALRYLRVALSEHRVQAFSIKGALNIFYFLKELCL